AARLRIDVLGLAEEDVGVLVAAEDAADRRADFAGRERAGRDLIEERLEEMEVAAVDERDVDRRMSEIARRIEPAEPAAENEDAVSDGFRMPESGIRLQPDRTKTFTPA